MKMIQNLPTLRAWKKRRLFAIYVVQTFLINYIGLLADVTASKINIT